MALTPGEGGAGGGSAGGTANSICAISPSDLVGTLGNLITRIEQLEFQLSQIVGANLHSEALSNISQQVGWVYGVEYMGIPGWTQTEYGTLIPPPGFTLTGSGIQMYNACTGEYEDYQAVVMDENGVLQFGATSTGNLCGEKVQEWNAAAGAITMDYGTVTYDPSDGWRTEARGVTINSYEGLAPTGHIYMTVAESGLYTVSAGLVIQVVGSVIGSPIFRSLNHFVRNAADPVNQNLDTQDAYHLQSDANFAQFHLKSYPSATWLLSAGEQIQSEFSMGVAVGSQTPTTFFYSLSVTQVSKI